MHTHTHTHTHIHTNINKHIHTYIHAHTHTHTHTHTQDFISTPPADKCKYVLDLYDKYVVKNADFPPRADVSHLLRQTVASNGKILLEGPQSYWLSNSAEKFWDSGTSASTCASGMLAAARINLAQPGLNPLVINIHKTPGSSRVGAGANPAGFLPQNHFSNLGTNEEHFERLQVVYHNYPTPNLNQT